MERSELLKVLLDSTALIHILKGHSEAINKIEELRKNAILYTTSINIYEVLRGIKLLQANKEKHLNALATLANSLNILNFDIASSEPASNIYAELRKNNLEIDPPDYMIAGCCLSNGIYYIVTKNERHFKHVKGLTVINY